MYKCDLCILCRHTLSEAYRSRMTNGLHYGLFPRRLERNSGPRARTRVERGEGAVSDEMVVSCVVASNRSVRSGGVATPD